MFDITNDIENFIVTKISAAIGDETVCIESTPEAVTGETYESKTPNGHILVTCIGGEKVNQGGSVGTRGAQYQLQFIVSIVSKSVKSEETLKDWMKKAFEAVQNQKPDSTIQPGLELTAFQSYHRLPKTGRWHGALIFTTIIRTP